MCNSTRAALTAALNEEAVVLNQLEDRLSAQLFKTLDAIRVGHATVRGSRELVYYVSDGEKTNRLLSEIAKQPQPRSWEFSISKDAKWRHFNDLVGPGEPECL